MVIKSVVSCLLMFVSSIALALEEKKFCIYDPVGKNGPSMTFLSDIVPNAIKWGLNVKLVAYTDERVASNDFKAGMCDLVFLTGMLTRQYVPFGSSLNAIGGIISENGVNKVLKAITNPKAGKLLTQGNYEIVGTFPVGGVYLFVNDREIDTLEEFSGKKISILNDDPQAMRFANMAGASPVGTSLATFSGQFNNGNIDILPMVPIGYNVFELYHGLGENGGIIDEKLLYGMMQLVSHKDRFPSDFGQQMREYILSRLSDIHKLASDSKAEIPSHYWIKTSDKTKLALDKFKFDIRLALKDEGIHEPRALKLLWKIRCSEDPTRSECSGSEN
tara:strand:+ start:35019 stop:36014 length:996 start_codon:yes stop_codon:yes gene_type:complete